MAEEKKPAAEAKKDSKPNPMIKLIIIAVAALVAIGAAAFVGGTMANKAGADPAAQAESQPANDAEAVSAEEQHGDGAHKGDSQFGYVDMEPIIVNLDEPRLARYVRANITLAVKGDAKPVAEIVEKKMPELKSWLTVYLSGCTLEDVRGPKNLNRICREIREAFNDQLWPGAKPQIEKVLLKEFAVQ